ncbi:MAG: hypothetical protein JWO89_3086 [Verrucomicrobiaceae bacterium]|nr:hypothetical protein [Verrucomicrobiaceae bacterium]MDB6118498.1 hypothetical protein [Verrucomicrobiaceae bacterium]
MSAFLQFNRTGKPLEVLELSHRELPPLQGHEVRVAMRYAPINPADLNFIEGNYGRVPTPPTIPGHEGSGQVVEIGPLVTSLAVGDMVIPLLGLGCWAEHLTAFEHEFAKLPDQIDLVQAAMLRVNPITAWCLIHNFVDLEKGEWIAQNAANSGVGRAMIQVAKHLGYRTLNFVRRPELIDELKGLGADEVLLDTPEGVAEAKEITRGQAPRLATNAVGGESAIRIMDVLAHSGTLVTYGAMSRASLKVPNKFMIFKDLTLRGLWVSKWHEQASHSELHDVMRPLVDMIRTGELMVAVDEIIPLKDFSKAIARAQEAGRSGKVILDLASV